MTTNPIEFSEALVKIATSKKAINIADGTDIHRLYEALDLISEKFGKNKQHSFYFHDIDSAFELSQSAFELFRSGMLRLPFKRLVVGFGGKSGKRDAYFCAEEFEEDGEVFYHIDVFIVDGKMVYPLVFIASTKNKFSFSDYSISKDSFCSKEKADNYMGMFFCAIMQINMPHYTISDSLSTRQQKRAAERKGFSPQDPAVNYKIVQLRDDIKQYFKDRKDYDGKIMSPHWRRGHFRRLDDRQVWVRPCMVNWTGDKDLPAQIYLKGKAA